MVRDANRDTYDHPLPIRTSGAGDINIAAVVIATIGIDAFRQIIQVSVTTALFG